MAFRFRTMERNTRGTASGRRHPAVNSSRGSGIWHTEDIPEEGIPSLRELRTRVLERKAEQHSEDSFTPDRTPERQTQSGSPEWLPPQGSAMAGPERASTMEPGERQRTVQWPTALVTLLPTLKDDITVAEGREKWKTFITQFENVVTMQPGAFSEHQKRVLLSIKGGHLIQKLLENLDTTSGVTGQNGYEKAKELCGKYFDSNSMKMVDVTTFRSLTQGKDEPFTTFVARLRSKARVCQFSLEQEAVEVAQQVMNGAIDKKEFLNSAVLFPDMTLTDIERLGTRFEMTRSLRIDDQPHKSGESKTEMPSYLAVNALPQRSYGRPERYGSRENINERFRPYAPKRREPNATQQEEYLCEQYCGRRHGKGRCPAYGKRCDGCGKTGHFRAVCKAAKREPARIKQVEDETKREQDEHEVCN